MLLLLLLLFSSGKEYETDQVFVSSLSTNVTEESLQELFGSIGIIKVNSLDHATKVGFGFSLQSLCSVFNK